MPIAISVLGMVASLLILPGAAVAAPASVDHNSQASVTNAYLTGLMPTLQVPVGWTGSVNPCVPGAPSAAQTAATIDAVNWFRSFVGLSPVTEDPTLSAQAQQAALMMLAKDGLSHAPATDWGTTGYCYTDAGNTAAGQSNLSLGYSSGPASIIGYMDDSDSSNYSRVGHRRWVLYPSTAQMGVGVTSGSGALYVVGTPVNPSAANPAWIQWPAPGYFPSQLLNRAWSISREGADFSSATVSVTKNGTAVTGIAIQPVSSGYGVDSLVWYMPASVAAPSGTAVDTYNVTVSGVSGGVASSVSYTINVFNIPQVPVGSASMSGQLNVGQSVTMSASGWGSGVSLTYQWYRIAPGWASTTAIPGATSATYKLTAADQGNWIGYQVTGNQAGYVSGATSVWSWGQPVGAKLPITPGSVSVSGKAAFAQTLSASIAGWSPAAGSAYAYQWLRDGVAISGATAAKYAVGSADVGHKLSVKVTATNPDYTAASATSAVTAAVTPGVFTAGTPTISGTALVGQTLTAAPGSWAPVPSSLAYQWLRNGAAISGATSSTYKIQVADAGYALSVTVTGSTSGYTTASKTSAAVSVRMPVATVSVTPSPVSVNVGAAVSLVAAALPSNASNKAVTWSSNNSAVATVNSSGVVTGVSAGAATITAKAVDGSGVSASAQITVTKVAVKVGTVSVSGTTVFGQKLTVTLAGWSPTSGTTYAYQWLRDGTAISGATASTYTLGAADVGRKLSVKVTASNPNYTSSSATSAATAAVSNASMVAGNPSVSGKAMAGQILTVVPGAWNPASPTFAYQWLRDGVAISGATASKYTVLATDAGTRLSVKVTGSLPGYPSASKTSPVTGVVIPAGCVVGTPATPMTQFTLGADMTGDKRGETLAVDSKGVLWVYPGTASGALSQACSLGAGFGSMRVYGPGDLNGDGKADILAISSDGKLWLYPGTGALALGTRRQVGYGWTGWRLIPAGDLNGDKKPDLLGINGKGQLFMYAGTGSGGFATRKQVGYGWTGWSLYAGGDLNGDGKNDILGINSKGDLYQYLGKGSGFFNPRQKAGYGWLGYTLGSGADLNGDGKADLVGRSNSTRILYFYKGLGGAHFALKTQIAAGW